MNRRHFLQTTALAAASLRLRAQDAAAQRDRFGGLRAVKFEATGFFRVEKRERWWLVTPEGHGWLGFGVNHVHPGWLNQTYNSAAWLKRFGAEKYNDAAWRRGVLELVRTQVAETGYNHFGVHNEHDTLKPLGVPFGPPPRMEGFFNNFCYGPT